LPTVGFALLALGTALAGGRWGWLWSNAVSRWLGVISYGVFLWHLMVIAAVLVWFRHDLPTDPRVRFATLLASVIPVALLVGWLSYRVVEVPGMRKGRLLAAHASRRAPLLEPAP
jgi:peptidoglycan/LPS O-acetylase OafA/YrhL